MIYDFETCARAHCNRNKANLFSPKNRSKSTVCMRNVNFFKIFFNGFLSNNDASTIGANHLICDCSTDKHSDKFGAGVNVNTIAVCIRRNQNQAHFQLNFLV